MMKLITQELISRFNEVGDQSEKKNPLIITKFFNPSGSGTWFATEYNKETNICYGYVTGLAYDEWGAFSIDELEDLKLPFGLGIERDIYFKETHFKDFQRQNQRECDLYKSNEESEQELDI